MSRDHARINLGIWADPDFTALPPAPQHLYLLLWTSPALTYCGTHDWRPGRLAARSHGWTADHIRTVANCLIARHFLVVDDATEEVLIRSWARFDGLLKQPRMAVSYANAYAEVASPTLCSVLVQETKKIRDELPDLACWKDDRVRRLLSYPSVSAKDLPTPGDPFGDAVAPGLVSGLAQGLPQTQPSVRGSVSTPPTPAPAPTPTPERGRGPEPDAAPKTRKRASSLPDDFEPNDTNRRLAAERGLDLNAVLAQFRDHAIANGKTYIDWHAALNTWLRRERPTQQQPQGQQARSAWAGFEIIRDGTGTEATQ